MPTTTSSALLVCAWRSFAARDAALARHDTGSKTNPTPNAAGYSTLISDMDLMYIKNPFHHLHR